LGYNAVKIPFKFYTFALAFLVVSRFQSGLLLAGETNTLYFDVGAGANFQQDTDAKFSGEPYTEMGKARFSPGEEIELKAGYKPYQWLAVELAAGFIQNNISSIGTYPVQGVDFTQFPVMANIVLSREVFRNWSVYVGAGAGFIVSQWDCALQPYVKISHNGLPSIGYYPFHQTTASDLVPGYEAMAGIRYKLAKCWSLKLGYQFLATTEGHNWTIDSEEVKTNPTMSHSLTLSLTYSF